MRLKIPLAVLAACALVAVAVPAAQASYDYPFILKWGESGIGDPGKFLNPQYVAVDVNGSVYVTDLGNKRVQKFDSDGEFVTAWGESGSNPGQFGSPSGIAVNGEGVYVVDRQLNRIQKFDLNGTFLKEWGSRGSQQGEFLLPNGIDPGVNGTVYVADTGNQRVQIFSSDGEYISEFGSSGTGDDQFLTPVGISVDNGSVYVADIGNHAVKKFLNDGTFVHNYDSRTAGLVMGPYGVQGDGKGNMYIADYYNDRIIYLQEAGLAKTAWGTGGTRDGEFMSPTDVKIDGDGYLYVTDTNGNRIQKFGSPWVADGAEEQPEAAPVETPAPKPEAAPEPMRGHLPGPAPVLQEPNPIVGDTEKPVIRTPEDLVVEATGHLTAIRIGYATAHDESGIQSLTNNAPSRFTLGTSSIIWTAIDGSGNLAVASQTITVQDTAAPAIAQPGELVVLAVHPTQNVISLAMPEATDAIGVVSVTSDAPEYFAIGTTEVTWTARDIVGNAASVVQKVRIVDRQAPTLQVPSDIVMEATSLENSVVLGAATSTDNSLKVEISNDAPEYFALGNTTVTWTASDAAGNSVTGTQTVSVTDTTAPALGQPETLVFEAVSATQNRIAVTPPYVAEVQNFTLSSNAPDVFPIGTTLITWHASDASGNAARTVQNVTVLDTTAPAINATKPVSAEAAGPHGTPVQLLPPGAQDATSPVTVSSNAPDLFALGVTNVTWTARDGYGNEATLVQQVTVSDTVPPQIAAPADIAAEATSIFNVFEDIGTPAVSDAAGAVSVENNAPTSYTVGAYTITWVATDESGNTATAVQIVTVTDTQNPVVRAPADVTVEALAAERMQVEIGTAQAEDAVGIDGIASDAPETFPIGITNVTWTATDKSGNTATAVQSVAVRDTQAPVLTPPPDVTHEAQNANKNLVSVGSALAEDAVGVASITHNAPALFPLGTTLVTWTASDAAGNSATAIQTVLVQDTEAPAIVPPATVVAEAASAGGTVVNTGNATASDIDRVRITSNAQEEFPLGETLVTWTATDASGNTATAVQAVRVQDTVPPSLSAPADIVAEAVAQTSAVNVGTATAYDAVSAVSVSNDAPAAFPVGITQVTWTATDDSGNGASAVQQVRVTDSTAPAVTVPSNVTSEASSSAGTPVQTGRASATDVGAVTITSNAPDLFPMGTTMVTWTATDAAGNSASGAQTITVQDTVPPTITAPANVTAEAAARQTPAEIGTAQAYDAIGVASLTNNAPSSYLLGTTQVTWTATDASGNLATAIQTVTVQDTAAPKLEAPPAVTAEAESADGAGVRIGDANATDIGDVEITSDAPEIFPIGETQVTWTATDNFGNEATAIQTVAVLDTLPPAISEPAGVAAEAASREGTAVRLQPPAAFDLTGVRQIVHDAPELFALGVTNVAWTATDAYGNEATAVQKVTIVDTTAPVISVAGMVTFEISGIATASSVDAATASDLVDGVVSVVHDAPELFGLDSVNVTWTATDASGNEATAVQTMVPSACGKPLSYYTIVMGTDADDSIRGTSQPDLMFLLRGDDVAFGERGEDCIFGGQGADVIFGGEGNDYLYGDGDGDVLRGNSGSDKLVGAEGYDIIDGGDGTDSCDAVSGGSSDLVVRCE